MFKLITIQDTILVPPHLFGQPRLTAMEHAINKRFSDRVIPHYGLCVALWDWVHVSEDRLIAHSGDASTLCTFRMVVFAPFPGEVLFSRINASHDTGLYLEMGFFDAIHVRKDALPTPSTWDESEKVWVWRPEVGGGELFMDVSNECVFRCTGVVYEERMKVRPTDREANSAVMTIWGSIHDKGIENSQGLGDPLWWEEGEEAAEEEGEEGYEEEGEYNQQVDAAYEEGGEADYEDGAEAAYEEGAEAAYEEGAEAAYQEGAEAHHEEGVEAGHEKREETGRKERTETDHCQRAEGEDNAGMDDAREQVEEGPMKGGTAGAGMEQAQAVAKTVKQEIDSGLNPGVQAQATAGVSGAGTKDSNNNVTKRQGGDVNRTGPKAKDEVVIKEEARHQP